MEEGVKGEGGDGQGEHIVACTIVAGGTSTASTDNQRGLLPAINQAMQCRIFHLQQCPKMYLARRNCTLCCLDGRTLSTAGLQNNINCSLQYGIDVRPSYIDSINGRRAASCNQYFSNSIQEIKRRHGDGNCKPGSPWSWTDILSGIDASSQKVETNVC
jgi:hypothetical protein